jgi:hypothetical protein
LNRTAPILFLRPDLPERQTRNYNRQTNTSEFLPNEHYQQHQELIYCPNSITSLLLN